VTREPHAYRNLESRFPDWQTVRVLPRAFDGNGRTTRELTCMSLTFRNITTLPSDPVSTWPTEGVQVALERGALSHWQRLAAEILKIPGVAPHSRLWRC
jgi:hypothetical protein